MITGVDGPTAAAQSGSSPSCREPGEFGEGVGADASVFAGDGGRGGRWGEADHLAAVWVHARTRARIAVVFPAPAGCDRGWSRAPEVHTRSGSTCTISAFAGRRGPPERSPRRTWAVCWTRTTRREVSPETPSRGAALRLERAAPSGLTRRRPTPWQGAQVRAAGAKCPPPASSRTYPSATCWATCCAEFESHMLLPVSLLHRATTGAEIFASCSGWYGASLAKWAISMGRPSGRLTV